MAEVLSSLLFTLFFSMTANTMANMFGFMDEASAALIIQLQIQDSQQLSRAYGTKGKGREGELSDTCIERTCYVMHLYLPTADDKKHHASLSNGRRALHLANRSERPTDGIQTRRCCYTTLR
jgi:hypothetical protein